jgi:hypothetical protein
VWSVGAGVSGIYRTQQTQLTTSGNSLFVAGDFALSMDSFSGPPFTYEGGTKSCESFGSAVSLQCTAPAGVWFAGRAVRSEAALDSFPVAGELFRRTIGQRAVRSHLVVVQSPARELLSDVAQVEKGCLG